MLYALEIPEVRMRGVTRGGELRDFRYLDVWHKAHAFTLKVYTMTETFPKAETFGLAATLRRGAAHLTMKIAEGSGQDAQADFIRCMQQARTMGVEVEYQMLLSRDLQFIETESYQVLQDQLIEVRRMLSGLMKAVPV
jgi:four helix bundle protein